MLSTEAHARILHVDTAAALSMPGVHSVVSATDVPGKNAIGPVERDDEVFASKVVKCIGYPIALVLAATQAQAQQAAVAVTVTYEAMPAILTIEEAIAAQSFLHTRERTRGDVAVGFATAEHVLEGEVRIGGQEHFYLEPQCSLCVPLSEHDEMEVFSSTQAPKDTQTLVADVLGVPRNRIVVRTKRIGGGFGGKETRYGEHFSIMVTHD